MKIKRQEKEKMGGGGKVSSVTVLTKREAKKRGEGKSRPQEWKKRSEEGKGRADII